MRIETRWRTICGPTTTEQQERLKRLGKKNRKPLDVNDLLIETGLSGSGHQVIYELRSNSTPIISSLPNEDLGVAGYARKSCIKDSLCVLKEPGVADLNSSLKVLTVCVPFLEGEY